MTAYTPNLPALITTLPGDHTRAPQTEFDRERQVLFLENLSITGSVRSAVASAGVSHQTAYRARRATGAFRTAWDAALVVARANAEATLASRAIDGVTEEVRYHGEVVGTRTRFSDRLLLAHLGRLDKLAEAPAAAAFADDFEGALARFGQGEEAVASSTTPVRPEPVSRGDSFASEGHGASVVGLWPPSARQAQHERVLDAGGGRENSSLEPCNTRSKSNTPDDVYEVDWEDEAAAEAELARIAAAMEAERPYDAPCFDADDPHGLIADAQHEAFVRGVPRWWLLVPPAPYGGKGEWRYAGAAAPDELPPGGCRQDDADSGARRGEDDASGAAAEPECDPEVAPEPEPEPEPEQEPGPAPVERVRDWPPVHGRRFARA